jgi:hypothetical protein
MAAEVPLLRKDMILRLLALIILPPLCSCAPLRGFAKARPAEPSPFLQHAADMIGVEGAPFARVWRNPSDKVWEAAGRRSTLHVAPVCLDHLRPVSRKLARLETRATGREQAAAKLAAYTRDAFVRAFRESAQPRREVVDVRQPDCLVVELALVELDPNPITGGVTRRAINLITVPGAESVVGNPLKGRVAIEGRLYDPVQKQVLLEFSDAEQNRSALILSLHDFNHYSHARKVVREWARQFEAVVRQPAGAKVKDSSAFMLSIW